MVPQTTGDDHFVGRKDKKGPSYREGLAVFLPRHVPKRSGVENGHPTRAEGPEGVQDGVNRALVEWPVVAKKIARDWGGGSAPATVGIHKVPQGAP